MIDTSKKIMELLRVRLSSLESRIKTLETERQNLAAAYQAIQGNLKPPTPPSGRKPIVMSASARKKIATAQRKRWAAVRQQNAMAS